MWGGQRGGRRSGQRPLVRIREIRWCYGLIHAEERATTDSRNGRRIVVLRFIERTRVHRIDIIAGVHTGRSHALKTLRNMTGIRFGVPNSARNLADSCNKSAVAVNQCKVRTDDHRAS